MIFNMVAQGGGTTPTGTLSITSNGTYDVASYASASVNVSGGGGITADNVAMRTISGVVGGNASAISSYAFINCSNITAVNFPSCKYVYTSAFLGCYNLSTVSLPLCSSISGYGFASCSALTTANFPECKSLSYYAFVGCYELTMASFPACSFIGANAFTRCYNLLSLYLLSKAVCSLSNVNAFTATPISNSTASTGGVYGSIFVPSSLYSSYLTATNWSRYSSRFVSV